MPHAKLPPSASHRWMNCAGSVHLIGDEPNTGGPAAMLGTGVHKVVEVNIDAGSRNAWPYLNFTAYVHQPGGEETFLLPPGESPAPDRMAAPWYHFKMDETAVGGAQMLLDEVARLEMSLFEYEIYSERYLDMSWLDFRLGGTADVTLVESGGGWIHLFDYKNGRIVVEVEDNEQFLNYAVGLLHEHPDAEGVHIHLVQPNAYHEKGPIRDKAYSADEIKLFEIKLKAAADATTPPNAPRRAGSWCTFCPATIRCDEFEAKCKAEAAMDFGDEDEEPREPPIVDEDVFQAQEQDLPGAEDAYRDGLARRAAWLPVIEGFAKTLRTAMFAELAAGRPVGNWKIVRGRANRKWVGEGAAFVKELAEKMELHPTDIMTEPELKSPAKVEKLGAGPDCRKLIKKVVGEYSFKPDGKLAIAPGDDPRPAVDATIMAAAEFGEEDDIGVE